MGSEIQSFTVQELVDLKILEKPLDGNHGEIHPKSSDFVDQGIPFVMASDLKDGGVDISNCKKISEEQAKSLRKGFSKRGDILLSHKATIGRTAIVGKINTEYLVLTPQVTYYRVLNKERLNPKYLKYYFDSAEFQNLFVQWAGGGSTRLYLGITGQLKLPITLPAIEVQNRIVDIVDDYDERLILNRQTNQTLEAMAQALFKSWFVDFDPVFDNIIAHNLAHNNEPLHNIPEPLLPHAERRLNVHNEGQNNADNVERGSTREVSAAHAFHHLFPQAFEQSDEPSVGIQGWVPKGWGAGCLSDISLFGVGKVDAAEINLDNYISTENMIKEKAGVTKASGLASTKQVAAFTEGQILISNIRPYFKKIWFANCSGGRSNDVLAFEAKSATACEYVYSLLYQDSFFEYMTATSKGTKMPRGDKKAIMNWEVTIPPLALMEHFSCLVKPLIKKVPVHNENNAKLESLRDTLLPKLISGELRIPDAEQATEALAK